ncbi:MAG: DUF421 domain-containing protein [Firmicutes bacterium]|nr:DUF421 domain-containing protein [Bacillota bacterium]
MEVLALVGRTAVLWLTALVVFRFMGKRTLGKMAPFDFAVAIMIGEAVAIGMESTHEPLINAIAITVALGMLQWLLTWLNLRFRWLEKLTQGVETTVVSNGRINTQTLASERMSRADLAMELRQKQTKLQDVKTARLEPTGKLSIEKKSNTAKKTTPPSARQDNENSR